MALVAPGAGLAPLLAPWSSWEDVPTVLRGKLSYSPWDDLNSLEVSMLCKGKLGSWFSGTGLKRTKNTSIDKHKTSAWALKLLLPGNKGRMQNMLKCFIGIRQTAAFSHTKKKKKILLQKRSEKSYLLLRKQQCQNHIYSPPAWNRLLSWREHHIQVLRLNPTSAIVYCHCMD